MNVVKIMSYYYEHSGNKVTVKLTESTFILECECTIRYVVAIEPFTIVISKALCFDLI